MRSSDRIRRDKQRRGAGESSSCRDLIHTRREIAAYCAVALDVRHAAAICLEFESAHHVGSEDTAGADHVTRNARAATFLQSPNKVDATNLTDHDRPCLSLSRSIPRSTTRTPAYFTRPAANIRGSSQRGACRSTHGSPRASSPCTGGKRRTS